MQVRDCGILNVDELLLIVSVGRLCDSRCDAAAQQPTASAHFVLASELLRKTTTTATNTTSDTVGEWRRRRRRNSRSRTREEKGGQWKPTAVEWSGGGVCSWSWRGSGAGERAQEPQAQEDEQLGPRGRRVGRQWRRESGEQ